MHNPAQRRSGYFDADPHLWTQGKRAESLEMFRQELECARRVLGEGHPSTQQSLSNYKERLKNY